MLFVVRDGHQTLVIATSKVLTDVTVALMSIDMEVSKTVENESMGPDCLCRQDFRDGVPISERWTVRWIDIGADEYLHGVRDRFYLWSPRPQRGTKDSRRQ